MTPDEIAADLAEAKRRRKALGRNWLFIGAFIAALLVAIFVLPRLGALGWIGGGS